MLTGLQGISAGESCKLEDLTHGWCYVNHALPLLMISSMFALERDA